MHCKKSATLVYVQGNWRLLTDSRAVGGYWRPRKRSTFARSRIEFPASFKRWLVEQLCPRPSHTVPLHWNKNPQTNWSHAQLCMLCRVCSTPTCVPPPRIVPDKKPPNPRPQVSLWRGWGTVLPHPWTIRRGNFRPWLFYEDSRYMVTKWIKNWTAWWQSLSNACSGRTCCKHLVKKNKNAIYASKDIAVRV